MPPSTYDNNRYLPITVFLDGTYEEDDTTPFSYLDYIRSLEVTLNELKLLSNIEMMDDLMDEIRTLEEDIEFIRNLKSNNE